MGDERAKEGLSLVENLADMRFAQTFERQQVTQPAIGGELQIVIVYHDRRFKQLGDGHGVAILTMRRAGGNIRGQSPFSCIGAKGL